MLVFAGLGNPGAKYENNRHNVGFMAADAIARRHSFSPWSRKFQGLISEGTLGGEKILLIKPQTFMNLSGQSVGEALRDRGQEVRPGRLVRPGQRHGERVLLRGVPDVDRVGGAAGRGAELGSKVLKTPADGLAEGSHTARAPPACRRPEQACRSCPP